MKELVTWCGAQFDCNQCPNYRCKMAQRFASESAIKAAHDRIETKRSIAGMKGLGATEKSYAITMLHMVFPEIVLFNGEKALLRVVGSDAVLKASHEKPTYHLVRRSHRLRALPELQM